MLLFFMYLEKHIIEDERINFKGWLWSYLEQFPARSKTSATSHSKVADKKTAALTLTCNRYSSVYFFKHPNFEIIPWEHIGLSWAHYTPYSQASPSLLSSICPLASWNSQCWQAPWRQRDLIIPSSRPLLSPGLPHHLSMWRVASWWASSSSPCFSPLPSKTFLGQKAAWQLVFVHLETYLWMGEELPKLKLKYSTVSLLYISLSLTQVLLGPPPDWDLIPAGVSWLVPLIILASIASLPMIILKWTVQNNYTSDHDRNSI